uniref:Aurora kinase n=1 Tax=Macrostomum lignano TaxID=282301 RepID=A0A1I8IEL7_9PLAT
ALEAVKVILQPVQAKANLSATGTDEQQPPQAPKQQLRRLRIPGPREAIRFPNGRLRLVGALAGLKQDHRVRHPRLPAPEMIANKRYDHRVDIWATGVLTYEFLRGAPPFYDSNDQLKMSKIVRGKFDWPKFFQPLAKSFIGSILRVNPDERASVQQLMSHAWIENFAEKVLDRGPDLTGEAERLAAAGSAN